MKPCEETSVSVLINQTKRALEAFNCGKLMGEPKYGPCSASQWKAEGTHYPSLHKALLQEHSRIQRTKAAEDNERIKNLRDPNRRRVRDPHGLGITSGLPTVVGART